MAKKEGSNIFSDNRLLSTILIILVVYMLLNGSVTGNAFRLGKDITKYISKPQQKIATLTATTTEKTCVTNADCSTGYSCKPVTRYTCQKDVTTTTTTTTTTAAVATCSDGIQNQGETKVDCGGANCPACPPTCTDTIKNQDETDIDCGGSTCAVCANGKACNNLDSNCASKYCKNNICAQYVPKRIRLVAGTGSTAQATCPTGFVNNMASVGNKIFVPKIPNPTSLSDFTAITLSGAVGVISNPWNWQIMCIDVATTTFSVPLSSGTDTTSCTTGSTLPCCTTGKTWWGTLESGLYDRKSSGVVFQHLANAALQAMCINAPNGSPMLIFKDVTTNSQVDSTKLGCPAGYSSAGIFSEYSGPITEYTDTNDRKYWSGDQTNPKFDAFTHVCEKL